MQKLLNRGANWPPKMEKTLATNITYCIAAVCAYIALKLVMDLMSLTAHPSIFAIDTQQLVNLKRNGHSKSLVDDGPGKGTSVCSLAIVMLTPIFMVLFINNNCNRIHQKMAISPLMLKHDNFLQNLSFAIFSKVLSFFLVK
jgi:hypothetical protein